MIFDDTVCNLGEGPMWHPERQQFFWFDILGKRLLTRGQRWQFDDYVSAAGWIDHDTLMVASSTALLEFNLESGTSTLIAPLDALNKTTRSNDGRGDPQGGFWIGTMGLNAEMGAGAIYRYYQGEVRKIIPDMQITNSICFAPDGTTAYYTDTNTQQIMAVTLDASGWPKGDPTTHIDLTGTDYRPDGAVVDQAGALWSAQWGAGRVAAYDINGTEIHSIKLPATQTTCPAFGGPNLTDLLVTSANVGLGDAAQEDGKTFLLSLDVAGQAEHQVIL